MKKIIENSAKLTGFVCSNAEIREFGSCALARFSLAISHKEKDGEETKRTTSFITFECWRRNGHSKTFELLTKGNFLTVEAHAKPQEYIDIEGKAHNKLVWVATKVYPVKKREKESAQNEA